jgi:hypothetical protein
VRAHPRFQRRIGTALAAWLAALAWLAGGAGAASPSPVELGAAEGFAVLGASTVTSTGATAITGDLGVSPGTAVTGFAPDGAGTITGTLHAGGPVAAAAHADLALAYGVAAARQTTAPLPAITTQELGPGVYEAGDAMTLDGTLTLDAAGDPDAAFFFKAGSTLTTAANSSVVLTGGAQACNVFWQVGSSATLGADSNLKGSILAHTSITSGSGVTILGRALARDAAVTLDTDTITVQQCARTLSLVAPQIEPFEATLTGVTQTVGLALGAWSLHDARSNDAGYRVTVSATTPTVDGSAAGAGTGATVKLTPRAPVATYGNPALAGPEAEPEQTLGTTATTIHTADEGSGQGQWDFPADTGETTSLALVIPGDASAGAYSTRLTFTTAPPFA